MVASTHAFSLHLDFASATVPFRDLDLISSRNRAKDRIAI